MAWATRQNSSPWTGSARSSGSYPAADPTPVPPPAPVKNYYAILELGRDATEEDIKLAHRRLAKVHHPDKNRNAKDAATARFVDITEAYNTLANATAKLAYDATLPQEAVSSEELDLQRTIAAELLRKELVKQQAHLSELQTTKEPSLWKGYDKLNDTSSVSSATADAGTEPASEPEPAEETLPEPEAAVEPEEEPEREAVGELVEKEAKDESAMEEEDEFILVGSTDEAETKEEPASPVVPSRPSAEPVVVPVRNASPPPIAPVAAPAAEPVVSPRATRSTVTPRSKPPTNHPILSLPTDIAPPGKSVSPAPSLSGTKQSRTGGKKRRTPRREQQQPEQVVETDDWHSARDDSASQVSTSSRRRHRNNATRTPPARSHQDEEIALLKLALAQRDAQMAQMQAQLAQAEVIVARCQSDAQQYKTAYDSVLERLAWATENANRTIRDAQKRTRMAEARQRAEEAKCRVLEENMASLIEQ